MVPSLWSSARGAGWSCIKYNSLKADTDAGASGELWCWGYNRNGQLGTGDTTMRNIPAKVSADGAQWSAIAAGSLLTRDLLDTHFVNLTVNLNGVLTC